MQIILFISGIPLKICWTMYCAYLYFAEEFNFENIEHSWGLAIPLTCTNVTNVLQCRKTGYCGDSRILATSHQRLCLSHWRECVYIFTYKYVSHYRKQHHDKQVTLWKQNFVSLIITFLYGIWPVGREKTSNTFATVVRWMNFIKTLHTEIVTRCSWFLWYKSSRRVWIHGLASSF